MHIGQKFKYLVENSELKTQEIIRRMGFNNRQAIYDHYTYAHVKTDTLLKMCQVFNKPISFFIDEDPVQVVEESKSEYQNTQVEFMRLLQKRIADLESMKVMLEEKIECLENKLRDTQAAVQSIQTKQPVRK